MKYLYRVVIQTPDGPITIKQEFEWEDPSPGPQQLNDDLDDWIDNLIIEATVTSINEQQGT